MLGGFLVEKFEPKHPLFFWDGPFQNLRLSLALRSGNYYDEMTVYDLIAFSSDERISQLHTLG